MTVKKGPRLIVRRSHFEHPNSRLAALIEGHPFNCALQLFLPERSTTSVVASAEPSSTESSLASRISGRPYCLLRCQLACLADEEFVERHIRAEAAQFCALSVNTPLDRTDAAAILPDGRLVLSVTKDTYETLGLLGTHDPENPGGYRISNNLFGKKHRAGAHQYERVMECLRERTAPLDMLCVKTIDGESAAVDWEALPGVAFSQQESPSCTVTTHSVFHAPDVVRLAMAPMQQQEDTGTPAGQEAGSSAGEPGKQLWAVHEWLGAVACGMTGEAAQWHDEEGLPGQQDSLRLTRMHWQGLLPACSVADAVQACRQAVGGGRCPWAAAAVWGFADAPTSWQGGHHGRGALGGGEADYVVLVLPGGQYILFVMAGQGDGFMKV